MRTRSARRILAPGLFHAVAALGLAAPLAAQSEWSAEFDRPGLLGRVFALGEYQGQLVAGGLDVQGDGHHFGLAALFDGEQWQPLGPGLSGGTSGTVRAFAEFQGELVAGGSLCCAGPQPLENVARWNGAQWSPLGAGIDGEVFALALYQGELYAAGSFSSAGGVAAQNVARWDGAAWHPVGPGASAPSIGTVWALVVGPDGRLYASGEFAASGNSAVRNVAAWNGSAWSAVGGGLPGPGNGIVYDLAWFQGELYAGANFDLVSGASTADKVAVFDGTSWSSAGEFPDSSIGTSVQALDVYAGALYAGGNIVSADGVSVHRMARFDGVQWSSVGGVGGSSVQTHVFDFHVHGGRLVAGGEFSLAGFGFAPGQPVVAESVAAHDAGGWASVGRGLGFDAQIVDGVLWNGAPVVVGSFSEAGAEFVAGPVRLEPSGWRWLGHVSGHVFATAVVQGDLVVAGEFTSIDGQAIEGVARYDGTQWHGYGPGWGGSAIAEYQGQLYVGGLGGVKRWNGSAWESFAPQLFGQVVALHVHAGVLYIGGFLFSDHNLVSWNGTTQQVVAGGTNGAVNAFASYQGQLVVGGEFTIAGGVAATRLARWNGSAFSAFPGITGTNVDSLAIFDGELVASGNLFLPGLPPEKYLAHFDGASWLPFGAGIDGPAAAIVPDEVEDRLYVAGLFSHAGNLPAWYFASFGEEPETIGSAYCFGDGTRAVCPCFNVDPSGAAGCANSSGSGSILSATGSASVAADDVVLRVAQAVANQPGLLFQGDARTNGGTGVPFGEGLRCASQAVVRIQVLLPDASGSAHSSIQVAASGDVAAGDVKRYQFWYRDPAAGSPCGLGFNLSNGLEIVWSD